MASVNGPNTTGSLVTVNAGSAPQPGSPNACPGLVGTVQGVTGSLGL